MTPLECLEARARLGWSRQTLADASGLATPIVRLYEAGALEGFDACEAAIAEALYAAEAGRLEVPAGAARAKHDRRPRRALAWLVETGRRWGLSEDTPMAAYGPPGIGAFGEIEARRP